MAEIEAFDTAIVGAGAAGLAAAAELGRSEGTVCLLEARDRVGGRVFTRREPDVALPVELGAEFIHGRPKVTLAWLAKSNVAIVDAIGERWTLRDGKPEPANDLFEQMKRGLTTIRRPGKDLPFVEFLERNARRKLSPAVRELARALVEGFDAADATRVSTWATLEAWSSNSSADAPTFRPLGGYASLIDGLLRAIDASKVQLRLNTIVHTIRWRRGRVRIEASRYGQPCTVQAKRAIIALPLGVLQLPPHAPGAVRFLPDAGKRHALAGLASGPAIKLVLHFRKAFWEEIDDGRYRNGSFFRAPDAPFRTFWSSVPLRSSLLNAWAGGPAAQRLAGLSASELIGAALDSVQSMFGRKVAVRRLLANAYLHDWQADPFANGAYSYVIAGGTGARKILATPVQDTLFFAGEAADTEGEWATVAGALQSGMSAARRVMEQRPARAKRRRK